MSKKSIIPMLNLSKASIVGSITSSVSESPSLVAKSLLKTANVCPTQPIKPKIIVIMPIVKVIGISL
jgi:hypothetical protein